MKHTLLIITALMLVVGCSSDPIDGSNLVYKDGLMYAPYSGEAVWYYENGQKERERTYKDGEKDGLSTAWYDNGQKSGEGTYKDGKPDGSFTYWHENGQKSEERTYKDGELDGKATGWYENGQKSGEITYKNGAVISEKCWDEDGNEIGCGW